MKRINTESKITITFPNGEKITATAGMLNQIVIWANESAIRYNNIGCEALAKGANETADFIYNVLDSKRLYND